MSTYTDLLRALADLIEEHQLAEVPTTVSGAQNEISIHAYGDDARERIAAWRKALGGVWEKIDLTSAICLEQTIDSLPGAPTVNLYIQKDRCVRRVVGTEEVVVPAVEAQPERVEVRELVEWDCEPVIKAVA